jgi:hypothetical protein
MKSMPLRAIALATLATLVGLSTHGFSRSLSASPQQSLATWRYAYVVAWGNGAVVCFAEADGCRNEFVEIEPVRLQDRTIAAINVSATQKRAVVTAVHRLGNAGWEMVDVGFAYGHGGENEAVHFRRRE